MALKFLKDIGLPPPRVLAYGSKGSGKTSSLATLNKISTNGVLIMSEYGNLAPYYQAINRLGVPTLADDRVLRVDTYAELLEALDYAAKLKPDWLGHDSLSADSKMFEMEFFPENTPYGKDDSFQKWKMLADRLATVCQRIKDGPWKFAVTVGLEVQDGAYASVYVHGQKSRHELTPWAFNGVAHFQKPTMKDGEQQHFVTFAPDGLWETTCQFSVDGKITGGAPDWYAIFGKAGRL